MSWLLLVATAEQFAGADGAAVAPWQSAGDLLVKGQVPLAAVGAVVFAVGALALYSLLYDMTLVPRWLSGWGLLGAVLYLAAGLAGMFGIDVEYLEYLLALQEMVMAVWLIAKGFESAEVSPGKERQLVAG